MLDSTTKSRLRHLTKTWSPSRLLVFVEPMAGIEPATYAFAYTSFSKNTQRGLDCIFLHKGDPCQSFERPSLPERYGLGLCLTVNRNSGFITALPLKWAGLCGPPWRCSTN